MWTLFQIGLAVTMVVTGSINTLSVKWADKTESENSVGEEEFFHHPFLQSSFMFLGETLCFVAFMITVAWAKSHPSTEPAKSDLEPVGPYSPFLLLPPALCDVTATSVMYIALTLTSASSFQMLRGSIMIFVGILSVVFLKKKLEWFRWLGMAIIFGGLIVVGVSDFLQAEEGKEESPFCQNCTQLNSTAETEEGGVSDELIGDALVVAAQVVAACQFVYEEKYIRKYNIPALKVVGLEGLFGLTTIILVLIGISYIQVGDDWGHGPDGYLEDPLDGFTQIGNNYLLVISLSLTVISIAFFNFAGVSITKELSATTRKVLDTLRTLVIWAFSLAVGWQKFYYLQPIGFLLLVVGMLVYNDLLIRPFIIKKMKK